MLSAFLCDLLVKSLIEKHSLAGFAELQEVVGPAFSQHLKNNRVLRQNMQLLFDCVNEAIEVHRRMHRRKQHAQEFIGLQEFGKIICEQICSWGKQATEQININVSSTVEYGCYLQQRIGIEIGDAILNEVIQEVLDLF